MTEIQSYISRMQTGLEEFMKPEINPGIILSKEKLVQRIPIFRTQVNTVCGNPMMLPVEGTHYDTITQPLIIELTKDQLRWMNQEPSQNDLMHSTMLSKFLESYLLMIEKLEEYRTAECRRKEPSSKFARGYLGRITDEYFSMEETARKEKYPFEYIPHYVLESVKVFAKPRSLQGPSTSMESKQKIQRTSTRHTRRFE